LYGANDNFCQVEIDVCIYVQMILKAVASLNERGGSSKRAISKFIKTKYTDLPKRHDTMLALHLRRLRTKGALHMHRRSYKLSPRSKLNLSSSVASQPRGRPKKVPGTTGILAVKKGPGRPPKSLAVKKGPGRPPKSSAVKKGPGRPPKILAFKNGPGRPLKVGAVKKGPGRPPKVLTIGTAKAAVGGARKQGRPPKSEKKGPGRPRKEPGAPSQGGKKRKGPGRPRKAENAAPPGGAKKKGPGRPKKVASAEGGDKKGPGRPKKAKEASTEGSEKKGPGRPRKERNDAALGQVSGKKRGRGRPKKEASSTDVNVADVKVADVKVADVKVADAKVDVSAD
jgi:linker histone H1 and H5 family